MNAWAVFQEKWAHSTEDSEAHKVSVLKSIYDKGGKNIWWGKYSLFKKWYWGNWSATYKIMKLECVPTAYVNTHTHTHTTLKKNQRSKYKTRNHKKPRRKQGGMLFDINYIILDLSPKAKETKSKVNKWDQIKLESFCTAKGATDKMKRQHTKWEKTLAYNDRHTARTTKHPEKQASD